MPKRIDTKMMKQGERLNSAITDYKNSKKDSKGRYKKTSFVKSLFSFEKPATNSEETLYIKNIYSDGLLEATDGTFSKMIEFFDINYRLALAEESAFIFEKWLGFLSSLSTDISLQMLFVNQIGRMGEMADSIKIPITKEKKEYKEAIKEYRTMLRNQMSKGNNGLVKKKYLVISTTKSNITLHEAKLLLERKELEICSYLRTFGVKSELIDGKARLKILHDMININKKFDEDEIEHYNPRKVISYITPDTFDFSKLDSFKINKSNAQVSKFNILATELDDVILSQLLKTEDNLYISIHVKPIEQIDAIKMVKHVNTSIQKMTIEEQQKAYRNGYDIDIIPNDLKVWGDDVNMLLKCIQSRDEKLFIFSVTIMNINLSMQKVADTYGKIDSILNTHNCKLKKLNYMQEQGFVSVLPIGVNKTPYERHLTSTALAGFMPFSTCELFVVSNKSMYYGLNALSHNLIMANRLLLKNPNGLILGKPGSGKSFATKREMANVLMCTDDDILICDPESEYGDLVKYFGGTVIEISANSNNYINPLDISLVTDKDKDPIKDKADFIISFMELIVGRRGLTAKEMSIIDRCIPKIYEKYMKNPLPENMPILEDLSNALKLQEPREIGINLATEMELYVTGTLNVFNHRTTVDLNKHLLSFDIKNLQANLKKVGMLIIQEQVWNKVSANRDRSKITRYYIDEFHLLLSDEQTARYVVNIWKRFRKWGGVPTGITQNVKDLLRSQEIENIFDNTDFYLVLDQGSDDREILTDKLAISEDQSAFITNANEGCGLIFYGNICVPFEDKFPKNTILYKMMTTKPEEKKQAKLQQKG